MKKFIIVIMGLYTACLGILCGWLAYLSLTQASSLQNPVSLHGLGIFFILVALFFLIIGAGLILRKVWSRLLILGLSALSIVIGVIIVGSVLLVGAGGQSFPSDIPAPKPQVLAILTVVIGIISIIFPLFNIVFLTRPSVAALFSGQLKASLKNKQ